LRVEGLGLGKGFRYCRMLILSVWIFLTKVHFRKGLERGATRVKAPDSHDLIVGFLGFRV
jgi:hypothetical protein